MDIKVHEYFRRWLEILISGTLDICMLSKSEFGLDIIDPLTKFIQCRTIFRKRLKNSKHEDIRVIHELKSLTNIQCNRFNSTREIVKSMRSDKQDKIKNKLTSQGFMVSFLSNKHLSYGLLSKVKYQETSLTSHFVT